MKIVIARILSVAFLIAILLSTTMLIVPRQHLPNYDSATVDSATKDEVEVVITTMPSTQPTTQSTKPTQPTTVVPTTIPPTTKVLNEAPQNSISDDSVNKDTDSVNDNVNDNEPEEPKEDNDDRSTDTKEHSYNTLLDIDSPDPDYTPAKIELSSAEREEIACIVMGEFGGGGYTGCALLAQCIRDAMDKYGYSGLEVKSHMSYYGYNPNPSSTAYEAVDWIFDGNAAVQHRILVMNNSDGGWHSTQNFVVYYQGVWFYDLW